MADIEAGQGKKTRKRARKYETAEAVKAREKECEKIRAAKRASTKQRFYEHRARLEARKKWQGPRKYEEWLLALAERELAAGDAAEAAVMPEVTTAA